jgi:hypothetical protein
LEKVILFFLLFLSLAEGIFYCSFSTPAYTLDELSVGLKQIIEAAIDHPKIWELRSKIEKLSKTEHFPTSAITVDVPLSEESSLASLGEDEL